MIPVFDYGSIKEEHKSAAEECAKLVESINPPVASLIRERFQIVEPKRLPDLSHSRAGRMSKGAVFPVVFVIASASSRIVVSTPEAMLYASPGVPPIAQAINPRQISSTKIKSRLTSPPLSRGRDSPFKDFHMKVGVTLRHTVAYAPRH